MNKPENVFEDESGFIKVCDEMINSLQSGFLPADWIPQVILTGAHCIIWGDVLQKSFPPGQIVQ